MEVNTNHEDSDEEEAHGTSDVLIDVGILGRRTLQQCRTTCVSDMEPGPVLDVWEEMDVFKPVTKIVVRDTRELCTTSERCRAILRLVDTDPTRRYVLMKQALARTGQSKLLYDIEQAEIAVHEELTGEGYRCSCTNPENCELLGEIRCPEHLHSYLSKDVYDLQQQLIQLYLDQCTRVPLYPLDPDAMERVDKLFVKPNMEKVDTPGRASCLSGRSKQNSEKEIVTKYRDIFYDGKDRCRNIYITGEAGVGKTALCESIVLTWCNAHLKKDNSEDGKAMLEFPLLFYVALRNCTGETHVEQMIENQLEVSNASEVLEKENCLIILDGLDEWEVKESANASRFITKGLPVRKIKGKFTILTTTRPWKLEILRPRATEIDRHINITGFSDVSLGKLTNNVIGILNESTDHDKYADDFQKDVENSKLKELAQLPVMLLQMLCLWHSDMDMGNTQCEAYSSMIDRQLEYAEQVKRVTQEFDSHRDCPTELPNCLKGKDICNKYRDVLLSLSHLAFQLFSNTSKESSLVFSHKQTEILGMTEEHLRFSLKTGLLTQHRAVGKITEKLKTICFLHKTYQEFFAAVFLSTLPTWSEIQEELSKCVYNLETFLEMAKVCVFVVGMKPAIVGDLFAYIMDVIRDHPKVQDYRTHWHDIESYNLQLMEQVQSVFIEALKEITEADVKFGTIPMSDIIILRENVSDIVLVGKYVDATKLKSVYLNSAAIKSHETNMYNIQNMFSIYASVMQSVKLSKLCILDSSHYFKPETLYQSCIGANKSLKCLVLISAQVSSLGQRFAEMLRAPLLSCLVLRDIKLTHEQTDELVEVLSELIGLKQLNLSYIKCATHDDCDNCFVLDLSNMKGLENLFLYHLNVSDVLLTVSELESCSIIDLPTTTFLSQLKNAPKLRKLICFGFKYTTCICAHALVDILPNLPDVNSIDIRNVAFNDMDLKLSQDMTKLEVVSLSKIVITDAGLRRFVDSLPFNGVRVHLQLTLDSEEGDATTLDYIKTSSKFIVKSTFVDVADSSHIFVEFCTAKASGEIETDEIFI